MRLDNEIQRDVESELKWTPEVDDTDVSIKVQGGRLTLTALVPDSFQKYRAERAARRVKGVAAVANDIQVRLVRSTAPTDPEIARARRRLQEIFAVSGRADPTHGPRGNGITLLGAKSNGTINVNSPRN